MEKIQLTRSTESEDLTEEEYLVAQKAVRELREAKKLHTELHQMSSEDAQKATASGRVHGDPFIVIGE